MQYDDRPSAHVDALPALELYDAASVADVQELVFPVRKGAPVLPCEVVVRRMVFMRIRFAGLGRLPSGSGDVQAELPLDRAYRAVVYLVHEGILA